MTSPMSRDAIVWEAIQRIYRPAVVRHVRIRLTEQFGTGAVAQVRVCFRPDEWAELELAAEQSRASGALEAMPTDGFDLLDIAKFASVFEHHFDLLFPGPADEDRKYRSSRRDNIVGWARMVRNVRNPLSHPVEEEVSVREAVRLIDLTHCVVKQFDASAATRLSGLLDSVEQREHLQPLLDTLPEELAVRQFVGREFELGKLWEWLRNPDYDRWLLAGEGGRGKTAIASEFARRVRNEAPQPLAAVLWMTAKKRALVEREVVTFEQPQITDLRSAVVTILEGLGFLGETPDDLAAQKTRVEELLFQFPSLVVLDDVDSLEGADQSVLEFLTRVAARTDSKLLLTSRRELAGLSAVTTQVAGLPEPDGLAFIDAKVAEFRMDAKQVERTRGRIWEVTEGNPLFIEDLLRYMITGVPADTAIRDWRDRKGQRAREYALGREVDFLSASARNVLLAASLDPRPSSREELRIVTGLHEDTLDRAIRDLQNLFLMASPRLIENEMRLEVDNNTRSLVLAVVAPRYPDDQARLRAAREQALERSSSKSRRGPAGDYVRQAIMLGRGGRHDEAELTLLAGLEKFPEDPVLIGQLGVVYKTWRPVARLTDAREKFKRAYELGSTDPSLFWNWIELERREEQWGAALRAAEKAHERVPNDQYSTYQSGYVKWRAAQSLRRRLDSSAADVLADAIRTLRRAIVSPEKVTSAISRDTNAKAFFALAYALSDVVRYRLSDGFADGDRGVDKARVDLDAILTRWANEHPEDEKSRQVRSELTAGGILVRRNPVAGQ